MVYNYNIIPAINKQFGLIRKRELIKMLDLMINMPMSSSPLQEPILMPGNVNYGAANRPIGPENLNKCTSAVKLLRKVNSFLEQGLTSTQGECKRLWACGRQIGWVRPDVAEALASYPGTLKLTPQGFQLNPQFTSYDARTAAVDSLLRSLRASGKLVGLKSWREEKFEVWDDFGYTPLFRMERAAFAVLGVRAFGVHLTGYTPLPDGSMGVWLQKRAITKPTYPGMMDTTVGGGIAAGSTPSLTLYKEAAEEASIPDWLCDTAHAAGSVSFITESARGIHANTEFVYDVELPSDFTPTNADGEVDGFDLIPVKDFLGQIVSSNYKLTSVPIALDFMVRHGRLTSDMEPNLPELVELMHVPLHTLYSSPMPTSILTAAPPHKAP